MKAWNEFLDKYYPEANRADGSVMYGYTVAQGLVHVLKACGDDLTRENVMKQAASIKDLELGGLLPGIKVNTSATDFAPISQVQLMKFKGESLGAVRRNPLRRRRRLVIPKSDRPICGPESPRGHPAGVFFCGDWMDNQTSRPQQLPCRS